MNKETLYSLYIEKGMTALQISKYLGLTKNEVHNFLRKFGIRRGKNKMFNQNFRKPLTKQFLIEHWINQNLSVKEIMNKFNISESKIRKSIQKFGIKKTTTLIYQKSCKNFNPEHRTKEYLEKLYYDEKLNLPQIGEKLKISTSSVISLFKRRGIPISKNLRYERVRKNFEIRYINQICKRFSKEIQKLLKRKRFVKNRKPQSERLKAENMIRAIYRMAQRTERTEPEIKAGEILRKLLPDKLIIEQEPVVVLNDELLLIGGYCVDFYIKRTGNRKHTIVIEVDSRYHHRIEEISDKDEKENYNLVTYKKFTVIRIWDDQVNESNIGKLLKKAKKEDKPQILRVKE